MTTNWTIGVDEAGRGPLAGPVSVGVCAVPDGFDMSLFTGIRDSKTLSEKKRDEWYTKITKETVLRWSVVLISAEYIDREGIVPAIRAGLTRALQKVTCAPEDSVVLLDGGLHAPEEYGNQKTIIRGDASEPLISAAAILAKVTRDHYMLEQAHKYPEYGFERHKGYGTKQHREAIVQHGMSKLHRKTFCHL